MELAGERDAVFKREGDIFLPTEFASGPWGAESLHGGVVAALLARTIESSFQPVPMRVARITVDLMRAVPMRPLRAVGRAVRTGRRIQVVDATLLDGDREVARASALRVRLDDEVGAAAHEEHGWEPPPLTSQPGEYAGVGAEVLRIAPGFLRAVDFERNTTPEPNGSTVAWTRLRCMIVDGEPPSPLVRLAASADFTSGTASRLDFTRWLFINPDLTLHLERDPIGEWIAVEAWSTIGTNGGGQSNSVLHDLQGPLARTQASMLVDRRA